MRVLITRPAPQAADWVQLLRGAGLQAEALPLIGIEGLPDTTELQVAWASLPRRTLVFFVSPNAVAAFFAARPAQAAWPSGLRAASPGPGTTQALRAQGVSQVIEPAADAVQFDSESLWVQLAPLDWAGGEVLIVRGTSGREWLADRLRERGAQLTLLAAYQRSAPVLSAAEQGLLAAALASPQSHVWLFSSSEAIDHLATLAPSADWPRLRAVATHPRIAERARRQGLAEVMEARPSREAVVACIQSFAS